MNGGSPSLDNSVVNGILEQPSRTSAPADGALLEVADRVTLTARGREIHAVDGLSYALAPGQTVAIIGGVGIRQDGELAGSNHATLSRHGIIQNEIN